MAKVREPIRMTDRPGFSGGVGPIYQFWKSLLVGAMRQSLRPPFLSIHDRMNALLDGLHAANIRNFRCNERDDIKAGSAANAVEAGAEQSQRFFDIR